MTCLIIVLTGCAAGPDTVTDGSNVPAGYPTMAATDFNGTFEITEAAIGGDILPLDDATVRLMTFDVVTGAATVELGCRRALGSFTFAPDQRASITLTGGNTIDPCPPSTDSDEPLWDLIDRIEQWESTGGGFQLVAGSDDRLTLTRI